jgi:tetratricopeptide (TPR) repeat protein
MNLPYLNLSTTVPTGIDMSQDFKTFLAEYKKHRTERPDVLIRRCLEALSRGGSSGADASTVHEALFNAAGEVGDSKLAKTSLDHLKKAFPDSIRVGTLSGRYLELCGEYEKALTLYTELLTKDVSNISIMKRKVCCYRQMRNTTRAVQTLHEILTTYSSDVSCWYELYEHYLFYGYVTACVCECVSV